eukprot:1196357-Prorocentrum_minimum.AAC.7
MTATYTRHTPETPKPDTRNLEARHVGCRDTRNLEARHPTPKNPKEPDAKLRTVGSSLCHLG